MTNNNKLINYENVIITPHVIKLLRQFKDKLMALENVKSF